MSVVMPFDQCIARPDDDDDGDVHSLRLHLEAVATACGSRKGDFEDRLGFLAGLLHDVAKAHADWQVYIRGERRKGPPHAPLGAALFAYCAEDLIEAWNPDRVERLRLCDLVLDWSRAVYDHHGQLDDLDDTAPPWDKSGARHHFFEDLDACDTDGISSFIAFHFPEIRPSREEFEVWLESFPGRWEVRVRRDREKLLSRLLRQEASPEALKARFALSIPRAATRLVVADRYHAGSLQQTYIETSDAEAGCQRLIEACRLKAEEARREGADPDLVRYRQKIQNEALTRYLQHSQGLFYALRLPTGYGKTLSALRIALTACASGHCRRIVYVAPYLSILSQNTAEISETIGMEVLQHHHLSLAELDDDQVEITDTWQAPILTTTFNQLFRAIFPRRAHQCLRLKALRNAFVVIDEPQIIDIKFWNIFLRVLSVMANDLSFKVIFTTATLPPVELGMLYPVIDLAPKAATSGRFEILMQQDTWGEADVAAAAINAVEEVGSVAVVMNTVRDAAQVYKRIQKEVHGEVDVFCLTSLMLPTHKSKRIQKIHKYLKAKKRVIAVCTQILEAGVDLSFRRILRALPILPSVAQVGGRANRHGEGERARVIVFSFLREDGQDSRGWVYRDGVSRKQTDRLLETADTLKEEDLVAVLDRYYRLCWDENPNTALLERKIEEASKGEWSALAGIAPFVSGPPRDSIFVDQPSENLSEAMQRLQIQFAPEGGQQLLEKYVDWRFRKKLNFLERKRFSALLRQYLVPVPRSLAASVGELLQPLDEDEMECSALWRLINPKDYHPDTGFAYLTSPDEEQLCEIV